MSLTARPAPPPASPLQFPASPVPAGRGSCWGVRAPPSRGHPGLQEAPFSQEAALLVLLLPSALPASSPPHPQPGSFWSGGAVKCCVSGADWWVTAVPPMPLSPPPSMGEKGQLSSVPSPPGASVGVGGQAGEWKAGMLSSASPAAWRARWEFPAVAAGGGRSLRALGPILEGSSSAAFPFCAL